MSDTHLYSVDSEGQATPPPPFDPGNRPKRAATKARPKLPVPTDRMKFDLQVQALRAICTASRNSQESVDANKLASLLRVAPTTAPLNNSFFHSLGLVEKAGRGTVKPTDLALRFQQKWTFDKVNAPAILAPAFQDSWFFKVVREQLQMGDTTVPQMVEALALRAETDDSYATQYGFCLDWLSYVGLITTDGGSVHLVATEASPSAVAKEPDLTPVGEVRPPASTGTTGVSVPTQPKEEPPVVSLSLGVMLTADDLAKLSAEQISSLFDGIGKVAAIKALLNKD